MIIRCTRSGYAVFLPGQADGPGGLDVFFSRLKADAAEMNSLRLLLREAWVQTDLAQLTDDEVVELAEEMLGTGELTMDREPVRQEERGAAVPQEKPAPAPPPPKQTVTKTEEPEAPTFGPDLHAAMQAATLTAAAAAGVPFCDT